MNTNNYEHNEKLLLTYYFDDDIENKIKSQKGIAILSASWYKSRVIIMLLYTTENREMLNASCSIRTHA